MSGLRTTMTTPFGEAAGQKYDRSFNPCPLTNSLTEPAGP